MAVIKRPLMNLRLSMLCNVHTGEAMFDFFRCKTHIDDLEGTKSAFNTSKHLGNKVIYLNQPLNSIQQSVIVSVCFRRPLVMIVRISS